MSLRDQFLRAFSFLAVLCIGCSIHIGNPDMGGDGKTQKLAPTISVSASTNELEQGDELELYLSKVELLSSDKSEVLHTFESETTSSYNATNDWTGTILETQEITTGTLGGIRLSFAKGFMGKVKAGDLEIPVVPEEGLLAYTIETEILIPDGLRTQVNLSFVESEALVPNTDDEGVVRSYSFLNKFVTGAVSVVEVDAEEAITEENMDNSIMPITDGLALHYHTTGIGSLYLDTACTIPASLAGQKIACIKDQSGAVNNLIQADSNSQPILTANGFGNYPTLTFDGDRTTLEGTVNTPQLGAHTVVLVGHLNDTSRNQKWFSMGPTDGNESIKVGVKSSRLNYSFHNNDIFYGEDPGPSPMIIVGTYNGLESDHPNRRMFLNGTELLPTNRDSVGGTVTVPATPNFILGRSDGGANIDGSFSELMIFQRLLSDAEIATLHAYLQAKYYK